MNRYKILLYITTALLLAFIVIGVLYQIQSEHTLELEFTVFTNDGSENIEPWKNEDGNYYAFLPGYAQLSQTYIILNSDTEVRIDGILLHDGMSCEGFEEGVSHSLTFMNYDGSLTFLRSGGMPTMHIDTASGSMEYIHSKKGNEETGSMRLYTPDGAVDFFGDIAAINGRGNYTWLEWDKKPYSIQLTSEADILGMGSASKWILLANAADSSDMRNKIVFDFADKAGLAYTPETQWVDLYLNGEYAGLYLLAERIEVHGERVNISSNGSFIVSMELDSRLESQNYTHVVTDNDQALRIIYPSNAANESLESIGKTMQSVENAIVADSGVDPLTSATWQELIDVDSWVMKYLLEEVFGNVDGGFMSQYFYLDGNDSSGRVYAGPAWDYDQTMGCEDTWQIANPNAFFANQLRTKDGYNAPWFYSLYQKEEFYEKMTDAYQTVFLPLIDQLLSERLYDYAARIETAHAMNAIRWQDEGEDALAHAEYIKNYMTDRISFLSSVWIEGAQYCLVRADQSFGASYAYYAVPAGECLDDLPQFENDEYSEFLGWYYEGTDEPFDPSQPITEDIEIYARWQDSTSNRLDNIVKLLPLGVFAVMFAAVVSVAVVRMKREWVRKDGSN